MLARRSQVKENANLALFVDPLLDALHQLVPAGEQSLPLVNRQVGLETFLQHLAVQLLQGLPQPALAVGNFAWVEKLLDRAKAATAIDEPQPPAFVDQETLQSNFKSGLIDREDVPDLLKELLTDCIHFDPEKRPGEILQLILILEKLQQAHPWSRQDAEEWWKAYDVYGKG